MTTRSLADTRKMARLRLDYADAAQDSLLAFTKLMMPDPADVEDPRKTNYDVAKVHEAIADACEECVAVPGRRLIITCPPRHGKTELASLKFMPWFVGKFPDKSTIFGTYNNFYAGKVGRAVRETMNSPAYKQVFPDVWLKKDARSVVRLELGGHAGGLSFAGRGGTITGLGGHGIIIDDPIKDAEEARSEIARDSAWEWYNKVISTRLMDDTGFILIIQTRWHEDDLVGRLTDPNNPHYLQAEARKWKVVDLPALAEEDDPLGRTVGEPLWPERFSENFLSDIRRRNPEAFSALYQGRPSVKEGSFFTQAIIHEYDPETDLPPVEDLTFYCAADLAVGTKTRNDRSCLLAVGVDQHDNIYVLPDIVWSRIAADEIVEQLCRLMTVHRPRAVFAEAGQISNSIGPFLRKRMAELGLNCHVSEIAPRGDKMARAQSIMARMAMGKVFFPRNANWYSRAKEEMLSFPKSARDDFVDSLAYIGIALNQLQAGAHTPESRRVRPGTFGAMLAASNLERKRSSRLKALAGWGYRNAERNDV